MATSVYHSVQKPGYQLEFYYLNNLNLPYYIYLVTKALLINLKLQLKVQILKSVANNWLNRGLQ